LSICAVEVRTSNYLVDQLYANVNVEGELKAKLPTQLQPLAGPIAGAVRSLATEASKRALANARVQEAWKKANYAADQEFVTIVNGGKGAVKITGGEVTLNLATIVANITNRLGLPNVSSKLPPSVAKLKVLKSKQIDGVQKIGKALKGLALLFTIMVPLLFALAVGLAGGFRRRTLMRVGIAIASAGVVVFLIRTILVSQAGTAISTRLRGEVNSYNVIRIDGRRVSCEQRDWDGRRFATVRTERYSHFDGHWSTVA